ncbi:MAG: hypothetical protein KUG56_03535 [Kordiimonadaceae bacterium]|nr:hypothetical protein [Kordiimonadaceae bacterium]
MSENAFIKKRQRERNRPFLTVRILLGLIFLSGMVAGGFYFEFGAISDNACEGACEGLHSLRSWLLGAFLLFAGIISAAAVLGGIIAAIKWSRNQHGGALSSLLNEDETAASKEDETNLPR